MTDAPELKFDVEAFDGEDRVITMNGKPIGQSLGFREAGAVKRWLPTAIAELLAASRPAAPPVDARTVNALLKMTFLLERLKGWDHFDAAADGAYWRKEIDSALALFLPRPAETPAPPQLAWEGPDEDGDHVVTLSGFPHIHFAAHGKTQALALHRLGDQILSSLGEGCEECAAAPAETRPGVFHPTVRSTSGLSTGLVDTAAETRAEPPSPLPRTPLTRYSTREIVTDAARSGGPRFGHNPSWIKAVEVDQRMAEMEKRVTELNIIVAKLEAEIATACEACPSIRMQDNFDKPLPQTRKRI